MPTVCKAERVTISAPHQRYHSSAPRRSVKRLRCWPRLRRVRDLLECCHRCTGLYACGHRRCIEDSPPIYRGDYKVVSPSRHRTEYEVAIGVSQGGHYDPIHATAVHLFKGDHRGAAQNRLASRVVDDSSVDRRRQPDFPRMQDWLQDELPATTSHDRRTGIEIYVEVFGFPGPICELPPSDLTRRYFEAALCLARQLQCMDTVVRGECDAICGVAGCRRALIAGDRSVVGRQERYGFADSSQPEFRSLSPAWPENIRCWPVTASPPAADCSSGSGSDQPRRNHSFRRWRWCESLHQSRLQRHGCRDRRVPNK